MKKVKKSVFHSVYMMNWWDSLFCPTEQQLSISNPLMGFLMLNITIVFRKPKQCIAVRHVKKGFRATVHNPTRRMFALRHFLPNDLSMNTPAQLHYQHDEVATESCLISKLEYPKKELYFYSCSIHVCSRWWADNGQTISSVEAVDVITHSLSTAGWDHSTRIAIRWSSDKTGHR